MIPSVSLYMDVPQAAANYHWTCTPWGIPVNTVFAQSYYQDLQIWYRHGHTQEDQLGRGKGPYSGHSYHLGLVVF